MLGLIIQKHIDQCTLQKKLQPVVFLLQAVSVLVIVAALAIVTVIAAATVVVVLAVVVVVIAAIEMTWFSIGLVILKPYRLIIEQERWH